MILVDIVCVGFNVFGIFFIVFVDLFLFSSGCFYFLGMSGWCFWFIFFVRRRRGIFFVGC